MTTQFVSVAIGKGSAAHMTIDELAVAFYSGEPRLLFIIPDESGFYDTLVFGGDLVRFEVSDDGNYYNSVPITDETRSCRVKAFTVLDLSSLNGFDTQHLRSHFENAPDFPNVTVYSQGSERSKEDYWGLVEDAFGITPKSGISVITASKPISKGAITEDEVLLLPRKFWRNYYFEWLMTRKFDLRDTTHDLPKMTDLRDFTVPQFVNRLNAIDKTLA